jgi:hypothetical protein
MLYLSLRKYYDEAISLASAMFGILMSIYNVVYFPNDYHTAVSLFVAIAIYLYVESYDATKSFFRRSLAVMFSTIFFAGILFLKQNIGAVLIAGCIANGVILLIRNKNKQDVYLYVIFVLTLIVSSGFYMNLIHLNLNDLIQLTAGNDSKGSVLTVIARIVTDEGIRTILLKGALYFILLLIYLRGIKISRTYYPGVSGLIGVSLYIFLILIFFRDPENSAIVLVVIYIYWLLYASLFKDEYDVLLIPFISLVYANSMTAGLCVGGLFLIMPFAIGYYFKVFVADNGKLKGEYLYLSFIALLFLALFVYKQNNPFNWWGLRQSEISMAKYELPYEELKYLRVDKATSLMFSDIKKEIDNKSEKNNDVYLYPDIPVFYQLSKKLPPTKNIVQWFDVISTSGINYEFAELKRINPKILIIFDAPWAVYKGHAMLKQSKLVQPEIIAYYDSMVAKGKYRMVKYQIYDNDYYGDNVNDHNIIKIKAVVRNPEIFGKKIDQLYEQGYFSEMYDIVDVLSRSYHVSDIPSHIFLEGDQITVKMKYSQVNEFVCKVGAPELSNSGSYVLRIYERAE